MRFHIIAFMGLPWCVHGSEIPLPCVVYALSLLPWDFHGTPMGFPWEFHGVSTIIPWWCLRVRCSYGASVGLPWCVRENFIVLPHGGSMIMMYVLPLFPWTSMVFPWDFHSISSRRFHGASLIVCTLPSLPWCFYWTSIMLLHCSSVVVYSLPLLPWCFRGTSMVRPWE